MNLKRTLRFSIIKVMRIWNGAIQDLAYILAPLDGNKNHPANDPSNASKNESSTTKIHQAGDCASTELIPTKNDPNHGNKKTYTCRENIKFALEGAGIIGGIIGVIFLVLQYVEMHRVTMATLDAVKVSQGQMKIAKQQLDDSEIQQRAWLQIDQFEVKQITNFPAQFAPQFNIYPGKYWVQVSFIIKNVGLTPAIDLHGAGETIDDNSESFYKQYGITNNVISKWNGGTQAPEPGKGGAIILPQQAVTNINIRGSWDKTNGLYIEQWISYRDVFGHADIVGVGGRYSPTNDCFAPDFIYLNRYNQTNQNSK